MESKPFAEVRWDDEDLRNALDLQGYSQTEKNIALLRQACEKFDFVEAQIAAGWDYMYSQIYELRNAFDMEYQQITNEKAKEIIETRIPKGSFWTEYEHGYTAIDNRTGDAWTADFGDLKSCFAWLADTI